MKIYHWEVVGHPIGKERPRTVRSRKGKVFTYTPKRTREYERFIQTCFLELYKRKVNDPDDEWVLELDAYYKGRRGDIDNVAKSVMDALNGFVWKDDKQVTDLHVRVHHTDKKEKIVIKTWVKPV